MIAVIRLILIAQVLLLLPGCNTTPPPIAGQTAAILVVNSNSAVPRYNIAEQAFKEVLGKDQLTTIDLSNDERPTETLQDVLNQQHFAAIYCIGAKALGSIDYLAPATPVVYSSVLSWRQFKSSPGHYGVTSEVAPAAQLAWFKHFFPQVKRIGVLYSDDNKELIQEAQNSANSLSLTLITTRLHKDTDRPHLINGLLDNVDALWVLPDPVVLGSEQHTIQLFEQAHQKSKAIFTYNHFYMGLGATLSIHADLATTGRQAALQVQQIQETGRGGSTIQYPAGSSISLNLKKVSDNQLQLNEDALNSVSELLDE